MKKYFLFFLLYFLFQNNADAQIKKQPVTDSLFRVLKKANDDFSRIKIFNRIAEELKSSNPDTAIYFSDTAISIATKHHLKSGIADAYLWKSYALTSRGDYDEALRWSTDALNIYDQLLSGSDTTGRSEMIKHKAEAFNCRGLIFYNQSNYTEALKNAQASLKIRIAIDDKNGIASSYNNIGNIYRSVGNYPEGLKNYLACLKIEEEIGNKKGIAVSSNHIGSFYHNHNNDQEALKYHLSALKLFEEIENKKGIADSYIYIGNIYYNQNKFSEALKNYNASLKLYEELGDKAEVANSYNNIGGVYVAELNYNEALKNYLEALKLSEELGDQQEIALCCNNIGSLYVEQKKTKDAFPYLNRGLTIATKISSLDDVKESYFNLTKLDSLEGNFNRSLMHYKLFVAARDSLFNEENTEKTVQAQMQFDFDKKETFAKSEQDKKDAITKNELKQQSLIIRQKNTLLYLSMFVLASLILISFLVIRNHRQKQIIQNKKIKELEQEKQLLAVNSILQGQEAERTRMAKDLHDGLGGMLSGIKLNLSSMKGNMIIQESDANLFTKSISQLDNAIAEMRRVAHNMMPEALLKFGLNEAIQDYCDGINESNTVKLKYAQLGLTKPLEKQVEVIIYRIVQELTNNAIKHADAKNILIQLSKHERGISLIVEDDGKGFNTKQIENKKGDGLQNVQSRVDYLKGSINIESEIGKGTSVIIEIPV